MSTQQKIEMQNELESSVTVLEKQTQRRIFKIIVIGDSNVGKTCLTYRFCSGKFPDKTEATIGVDFREKLVDVDTESLKVINNSRQLFIQVQYPVVDFGLLYCWDNF